MATAFSFIIQNEFLSHLKKIDDVTIEWPLDNSTMTFGKITRIHSYLNQYGVTVPHNQYSMFYHHIYNPSVNEDIPWIIQNVGGSGAAGSIGLHFAVIGTKFQGNSGGNSWISRREYLAGFLKLFEVDLGALWGPSGPFRIICMAGNAIFQHCLFHHLPQILPKARDVPRRVM